MRVESFRIIFEETETDIAPRGDVYRVEEATIVNIKTIVTPGGEELVLLSRADYEELIDTRDHVRAMAAYRRGDETWLTDAELDDYLAASTPLAYWRKRRGLTQAVLAAAAGISQPYLAQIEAGARTGDVGLYRRLARRFGLRMEHLVPEDR